MGVAAELPATLLALGVDPKPVLAAAGVQPDLLRDPENRISFPVLGALLETAVAASNCPHVGLLTGLRGGLHSLGLVGRLMGTAPTVREAILDLCVNQVRYIDGAVTYLTVQGGVGLWGYAVQAQPLRGLAAIQDAAMGIGIRMIAQLCGRQGEEARFGHSPPADLAPHRLSLGIPVSFDAEQTCLVLAPEVLAAPVRTADAALRRILQRQVTEYWARSQPAVAEQARRALAAQVTAGEASLALVARALGLGPRTLNRRLEAEGTSFRTVLEQARHDAACQLLAATRMPATKISAALGYASPAGFVRAFRRTAHQPPGEWRKARG
ncbi:AraC family transcriptional regulator ligand-binding domain-containing protein [Roseomonas sp. CAU 1739]|uniref:AraC family transcriptional regulator n=1 Tax=Roseomonas sp. CAU 1739 TaxID=3140364 RepID=UPI00325B3F05